METIAQGYAEDDEAVMIITPGNTRYGMPVNAAAPNWENSILNGVTGIGTAVTSWPGQGTINNTTLFTKVAQPYRWRNGLAFLAESSLYFVPPLNISPKTEVGTFFALVEIPNTSSGFNTIFSSRLSSDANFLGHRVYFIGGPSGAVLDYALGNNTGTGTQASQYRQFRTSEIFQANNLYAVAICSRSLSTGSCYVNGVNVTLNTAGTATNFVRGNGSYIGASPTTSSNTWFIYAYAVWNRALTDGELLSITSNPSQLFQKKPLSVPTYYPILSNLQAARGNTSIPLSTNITY